MAIRRHSARPSGPAIRRRSRIEPQAVRAERLAGRRPPRVSLVVDNDVALRRLLVLLEEHGLELRGHAGTLAGLLPLLVDDEPDAVILSSPARADVVSTLRHARERLDAPLVLVTPTATASAVRRWVAAGCDAVVLEADAEAALGVTVRAACAGQIVLPALTRQAAAASHLSQREKQALALVVMGLGNGEIARRLHVTEATVKSHLSSSFRKLGVTSRSEAAARILDPASGLGFGILAVSDDGNGREAREAG